MMTPLGFTGLHTVYYTKEKSCHDSSRVFKWNTYLCVGQHVPGVEAEAAPGFTSSAGLMITGWLSSSVSSLGNTTQTHIQGWNMIYSLTELHADTN